MKHYSVVCALIENENDELLCCKRGLGRPLEGYWEFPGGKVEVNETYEQAIIREIKEELDIVIYPYQYVGKSYFEYCNINPYDDFAISLYAYKCKLLSGKTKMREHSMIKWVKKCDMLKMNFAPADRMFIEGE